METNLQKQSVAEAPMEMAIQRSSEATNSGSSPLNGRFLQSSTPKYDFPWSSGRKAMGGGSENYFSPPFGSQGMVSLADCVTQENQSL